MVADNGAKKVTDISSMAKPSQPPVNDEMGIASQFPVTSWDSFSYGQSFGKAVGGYLLGRDALSVPLDKLVEMRRRDGQTRALLRMFVLPIVSCLKEAEWVMPDGVEGGQAEVEFANNMFRLPPQAGGMTVTLSRVLKQTLLALVEGFSAFEEVRQVPKTGPMKGKITLRKLAHRDSRTLQIKVDETGGYAGLRQVALAPDGHTVDIAIPPEKTVLYVCQPEENPYYGVSLFESAWFHYDIKSKLYYVAHIASQFAAIPGRVGTYPQAATKEQRQNFRRALSEFAFNTSITVPDGFKVEPFNSNSGFDFIKLIDHQSHLQAKSVLLQFADTENRMTIIDNGGKDASADMFVQALESIMNEIAELWSHHLLPKYIDWNFNSGKYPVFRFGQLTDSARDAVMQAFTTTVTASTLNCTPEFVRQVEEKLATRLGLDIDYQEIAKREEEAAKQQAQLAQEQAAAAQNAPQEPAGGGDTGEGAPAPAAPPQGGGAPQEASLSDVQDSLDDIIAMAQDLLTTRPQTVVNEYDG